VTTDEVMTYYAKVRTLPSLVIHIHVAPRIWESRDQLSPGFFLPKRKNPGNEVDVSFESWKFQIIEGIVERFHS
jgi:hypothetical protein